MPFPRSSIDDELRYLQKTPSGKWNVRLYIRELGYQVYFGTFDNLNDAQRERNRQVIRLRLDKQSASYKPVKTRVKKLPFKRLY